MKHEPHKINVIFNVQVHFKFIFILINENNYLENTTTILTLIIPNII
jgi:hypothetical protein